MRKTFVFAIPLMAALTACGSNLTSSDPAADERSLVNDAERAVTAFRGDADFSRAVTMMEDAEAVAVLPSVVKGAFLIGAEGGNGVLLARTPSGWSDPAFITVAEASFGLQAGAQASDMLLIVRTQEGLEALLSDRVKLGGDVSVAVGPMGAGVSGNTTTNLDADIVAFADARGLFGGAALEGAYVSQRDDRNADYYGRPLTASQVLQGRRATPQSANRLKVTLGGAG